jgi:DtxR family Mn-dependent transcriptional regulator
MVDPRLALALFATGIVLLAVLFWPAWGIVPRIARRLRTGEREFLEDALKHIYKTARRGGAPSLESVAGALGVPLARAANIVEALADHALVRGDGPLELTDEGQKYALQVIRTHRLWERYLADRTGTAPGEWHDQAEAREHEISPAQADRIAASLGHPRYDPHGDPIPTATGEIPEPEGVPLPYLPPGTSATVVHVEDEPRALYARLVARGFSPGMRLRVLAAREGRLRVETSTGVIELDLPTAGNVTVRQHEPTEAAADESGRTLEDVEVGHSAEVVGLAPSCQGIQRRRLLDLGVVPGTRIRSELASTSGDPTAFEIRGALIALRREQQRWVRVRLIDEAA